MATPAVWSAPPFTAFTTPSVREVSYANGHWFYLANWDDGGVRKYRLQYTANPAGSWSEATLPANPTSYVATTDIVSRAAVWHDGTNYGLLVGYSNGSARKYRILHSTTPGGTWSSYEFDATDLYRATDFTYADGQWVLVGWRNSGSPTPAFVATSTTVNGTYTFDTTAASTGLSSGAATSILNIAHDGTYWTQVGSRASDVYIQTASSPTGAWTTRQSYTSPFPSRLTHQSGYWSALLGTTDVIYASDPTATWGTATQANHGLDRCYGVAFDGTAWLAHGYVLVSFVGYPAATYLTTSGDPVGTFATAALALGTASSTAYSAWSGGGAWVLAAQASGGANAELNYSRSASSLLRQRQSPLRTPSRVRATDLRQRQTPYIR